MFSASSISFCKQCKQLRLMWWCLCVCFRPHWPQPFCEAPTKNHLQGKRSWDKRQKHGGLTDWGRDGGSRKMQKQGQRRTKTDEKVRNRIGGLPPHRSVNMQWGNFAVTGKPTIISQMRAQNETQHTVKKMEGSCNLLQTYFLNRTGWK